MPTHKPRNYALSEATLLAYQTAALNNAKELAAEASLLSRNDHHARAYFLSVASIEEAGKTVMSFEGRGRDLRNPAVVSRLKTQFEDHQKKITYAFMPWVSSSPNVRQELDDIVRVMVDVKFGREPSMYVDIHPERGVHTPAEVIPASSSANCVRLANDVIARVEEHVRTKAPIRTTKAQDEFFTLKQTDFQAITTSEDFIRYYIELLESGEKAFDVAVLNYYRQYYLKKKKHTHQHGNGDA
jgi:AbiV family abortive infection protein